MVRKTHLDKYWPFFFFFSRVLKLEKCLKPKYQHGAFATSASTAEVLQKCV